MPKGGIRSSFSSRISLHIRNRHRLVPNRFLGVSTQTSQRGTRVDCHSLFYSRTTSSLQRKREGVERTVDNQRNDSKPGLGAGCLHLWRLWKSLQLEVQYVPTSKTEAWYWRQRSRASSERNGWEASCEKVRLWSLTQQGGYDNYGKSNLGIGLGFLRRFLLPKFSLPR